MKRAILILATALLGASGCSSRCETDITFFWHFPNPSGGAELTCSQAGVVNVEIVEDGFSDGIFACTLTDQTGAAVQGITLTNFATRAYQFELRGLDASGNIIAQDAFNFTPNSCVDNQLDENLAFTNSLVIGYAFSPPADCTVPSASSASAQTFIWYELLDQNGNVASVSDGIRNANAVTCGADNATITIPALPFGTYTLSRIQEVEVDTNGAIVVYHLNCAATSFQHLADGDGITATLPAQAPGGTASCF